MAEEILVVEPHSEHVAKGCPTCRRGIEEGQTIVICPRCHTVHHETCWFDAGGCGTRGCKGVASKRAATDSLGRPAAKGEGDDHLGEIIPVSHESQKLPPALIYGLGAAVVLILFYFFFVR